MSLCLHVVLYLIVKNGIEMANHMRTILTDFLEKKKNFFKFSQLMQKKVKRKEAYGRGQLVSQNKCTNYTVHVVEKTIQTFVSLGK